MAATAAPRVVSMVPSVTETLLAWGITPVACTRFCEQPDLTHIGGTKDPEVETIAALHPDLVVVDREENRLEDHDALVALGLDVHVLQVIDLDHLDEQLGGLADRLGAHWDPVGPFPEVEVTQAAFVPIWRRPWMALGAPTYGTAVLRALGIDNISSADGPYPNLSLADARARCPDLVVAPSEPYPFAERHRAELESVAPARFVDGRDLLWWGVRTRAALARLSAALA